MHDSPKLTSFITLRANGWSLASISLEISVPKSTLCEWDTKHRDQILRLKQLQLEKFQERFLPTYEDELARLRLYLDRVETALRTTHFEEMSPAYLLQIALYLRTQLTRMREQPSARHEPNRSQPLAGRITSHPYDQFTDDDLIPFADSNIPVAASRESAAAHLPLPSSPQSAPDPENAVAASCQSAVDPEGQNQNRTKPDETPGGLENGSLIINDFQQPPEPTRPVLHSQNEPSEHQPEQKENRIFRHPQNETS